MIITLTADQYAALDDDLYADDFNLREFPFPLVGDVAPQSNGGWAMAHPLATIEDEAVLHIWLDDRVAELAAIAALPAEARPAARAAVRQRLQARNRIEDRRMDRREARVEIRKDARIAARVAEKTPVEE